MGAGFQFCLELPCPFVFDAQRHGIGQVFFEQGFGDFGFPSGGVQPVGFGHRQIQLVAFDPVQHVAP